MGVVGVVLLLPQPAATMPTTSNPASTATSNVDLFTCVSFPVVPTARPPLKVRLPVVSFSAQVPRLLPVTS
jgi:hypothetical protein